MTICSPLQNSQYSGGGMPVCRS